MSLYDNIVLKIKELQNDSNIWLQQAKEDADQGWYISASEHQREAMATEKTIEVLWDLIKETNNELGHLIEGLKK